MKRALGLVSLSLALAACKFNTRPTTTQVVYEGQSQFSRIFVREQPDGTRTLQFGSDGVIQSSVNIEDPLDLKLHYTKASTLAWALVPKAKQVLIIGLGGGALPRYFHEVLAGAHIDAAELDPQVAEVAREYFALPQDERLQVHVGDGRAYVEGAATKWDLIILDAYGESDIPRHLATLEFLNNVKQHLAPGGVVAGNVWSRDSNVLYDAMVRTWLAAFGAVCVVPIADSSNRIFLSSSGSSVSASAIRTAAMKMPDFPGKAYAPQACLTDAQDVAPLRDQ